MLLQRLNKDPICEVEVQKYSAFRRKCPMIRVQLAIFTLSEKFILCKLGFEGKKTLNKQLN